MSEATNHAFTLPSFQIQTGQTCRVYTNENYPEWCDFNYGSGLAICNNGGDTATLRDGEGALVNTYAD